MDRLRIGALYAMLCGIWGSTWLAIRIGLEGAPPFFGAALRFALAFAVLVPVIVWRRSRLPRNRTEWALVAFVGVVLFTLDYGLIYWGESRGVGSGLAAILFATFVFQTALFAHLLLASEKVTAQKVVGIGIGFVGILAIFRGELSTAGPDKLLPMLAIVFSATCAAISSVAAKRWGRETDHVSFTALSMAVGGAGLFGLSAVAGERWAAPSWPEGILAIVYLALAGSVITFVTYWWLLKQVEATTVSYIAMITPIVAVFLAFTVGREAFDAIALGGAAVTITGIYVSTSKRVWSWRRSGILGAAMAEPDPPEK